MATGRPGNFSLGQLLLLLLVASGGGISGFAAAPAVSDPRQIANGWNIPSEGYADQPYIVKTEDGAWLNRAASRKQCLINDVPVINVDLYPTFLAAAGAPVPAGKVLDGESLLPLLKGGGSLKRQAIFWHFPGYLDGPVIRGREVDVRGGFRTRPISVIHKGDWKLHLFIEEWQLDGGRVKLAENHAVELYNLKDDIGEQHDLENVNAAKRDELLDELFAWQKSIGAPLPGQRNPQYAPGTERKGKGKGKRATPSDAE